MERFLLSMFHCSAVLLVSQHTLYTERRRERIQNKKKEKKESLQNIYILTVTMATCFATECSPHTVITFYIQHHHHHSQFNIEHFAMLLLLLVSLSSHLHRRALCYVLCYDKLSRTCVSSATLFDTAAAADFFSIFCVLLCEMEYEENRVCTDNRTRKTFMN